MFGAFDLAEMKNVLKIGSIEIMSEMGDRSILNFSNKKEEYCLLKI